MSCRCVEKLCLFCQKVIKERIFAIKQRLYGFSLMVMEVVYLEKNAIFSQANVTGAAMFVSYPTAYLCKMQHDWLTASQHAS